MVSIPYRMRHPIATVKDAVTALGGTVATSRLLRITDGRVSQYITRGRIAPAHHYVVLENLEARGFEVDRRALFGDVVDGLVTKQSLEVAGPQTATV